MTEKRTTANTPQQPLEENLPHPQILWSGSVREVTGDYPCRVVMAYAWTLPVQATDWEARPSYVYEVARRRDKMRQPIHEEEPLAKLPAEFFEAFIKRSVR